MDTREKILKAARELFAEKGYDKTTVDEIVERAGVAKGTFYNYFKSKEELIKIVALQSLLLYPKIISQDILSTRT
ncbi:TetR/AcrR family transcriptional regulator [Thermococcus sp. LS2]|uniref:TetR/AcrR family transcriptional regulator n=1 Tax=Thermococcus sp. LS2 TaxID=1638260 RepID=UPI00143AA3A7|nr:helix-turn-helix domain-containing protein [Thermococcus sp. LS2]NJE13628.1 TetR/AcrR family transcriptional regulator [Thermococcus sp. LS2]